MPRSLMTLWIAVVFIAVGTFVLRRMLNQWERLKNIKLSKGISGLLTTLQTNAIVLGAVAETIAVIGFLIAVLGGIKSDMFRAGAVALIVFLINFPRKSVWKKIVANLESV
jgi:Flp pilus assembly protein TadB